MSVSFCVRFLCVCLCVVFLSRKARILKITDYNVGNIFAQKKKIFFLFVIKWLHIVSKMCVFCLFFVYDWVACVSFIFLSYLCYFFIWLGDSLLFIFSNHYLRRMNFRGFDFFMLLVSSHLVWDFTTLFGNIDNTYCIL